MNATENVGGLRPGGTSEPGLVARPPQSAPAPPAKKQGSPPKDGPHPNVPNVSTSTIEKESGITAAEAVPAQDRPPDSSSVENPFSPFVFDPDAQPHVPTMFGQSSTIASDQRGSDDTGPNWDISAVPVDETREEGHAPTSGKSTEPGYPPISQTAPSVVRPTAAAATTTTQEDDASDSAPFPLQIKFTPHFRDIRYRRYIHNSFLFENGAKGMDVLSRDINVNSLIELLCRPYYELFADIGIPKEEYKFLNESIIDDFLLPDPSMYFHQLADPYAHASFHAFHEYLVQRFSRVRPSAVPPVLEIGYSLSPSIMDEFRAVLRHAFNHNPRNSILKSICTSVRDRAESIAEQSIPRDVKIRPSVAEQVTQDMLQHSTTVEPAQSAQKPPPSMTSTEQLRFHLESHRDMQDPDREVEQEIIFGDKTLGPEQQISQATTASTAAAHRAGGSTILSPKSSFRPLPSPSPSSTQRMGDVFMKNRRSRQDTQARESPATPHGAQASPVARPTSRGSGFLPAPQEAQQAFPAAHESPHQRNGASHATPPVRTQQPHTVSGVPPLRDSPAARRSPFPFVERIRWGPMAGRDIGAASRGVQRHGHTATLPPSPGHPPRPGVPGDPPDPTFNGPAGGNDPDGHGHAGHPSGGAPDGGDPGGGGGDPPDPGPPAGRRDPHGIPYGFDWRKFVVAPHEVPEKIQETTGTITPWRYPRREVSSLYNHPVRFSYSLPHKRSTLMLYDADRLPGADKGQPAKHFLYGFPRLPPKARKSDIFSFLHRLRTFASGFAVYLPPPHTVTYDQPLGNWWRELPAQYRDYYNFLDQLLYQGFAGKQCNMYETPELAHLLHKSSGYMIHFELIKYAGHPGLNPNVSQVEIPRQSSDMSLTDYSKRWEYFLYAGYLQGTFYSDRFYVETFSHRMHPHYKDLSTELRVLVRRLPVDGPVPDDYNPENILEHLRFLGTYVVGFRDLDLLSTPRQLREPRSRPTRQLEHEDSIPLRSLAHDDDELGFLNDDDYLTIRQLSTPGRRCDLCRSSEHLLRECPRLRELRNEQASQKRIMAALRRLAASPPTSSPRTAPAAVSPNRSSSPAATARISNRSSDVAVRAVDRDHEHEDDVDDLPIHALSESLEDDTIVSSASSSDFRSAGP